MSLIAILALALALGAVWRLLRFTVRIVLLVALIALIASYSTRGTSHHAPRAPGQTVPARPAHRGPRTPATQLDGGACQPSGPRGRRASDVQSKDRDETWCRDFPRRT